MTYIVPIIGLSGTNGSGKDTVGILLSKKHKFLFISVSDLLRDELKKRGLTTERENMRTLSAEWRREFGLAVLVDRAVATFNQTKPGAYAGLVMASLRNPYEARRVHELGGTMVWVDADPKVRYRRVQANKRAGRAGDDNKGFEQFLADEQIEMNKSAAGDDAELDIQAVHEQCDHTLINNFSDIADLEAHITSLLRRLKG
jgi:cytidylate kinase